MHARCIIDVVLSYLCWCVCALTSSDRFVDLTIIAVLHALHLSTYGFLFVLV